MLEQSRETNLLIPSKRASPHKFEERLNCLTARGVLPYMGYIGMCRC